MPIEISLDRDEIDRYIRVLERASAQASTTAASEARQGHDERAESPIATAQLYMEDSLKLRRARDARVFTEDGAPRIKGRLGTSGQAWVGFHYGLKVLPLETRHEPSGSLIFQQGAGPIFRVFCRKGVWGMQLFNGNDRTWIRHTAHDEDDRQIRAWGQEQYRRLRGDPEAK